jgi:glycosyltransferase involved in cell wall biosynthesis
MAQASSVAVTWLPTHPGEGWISMNRYHMELENAAQGRADLSVQTLMPKARLVTKRNSAVLRGCFRYVIQPVRARATKTKVAHILDHSCAYLIPHLKGRRVVVTVHDLIPILDENLLSPSQRGRFEHNLSHLKQADHLVCNSTWTRGTVIERLGIPESKVSVSLLGVDGAFARTADYEKRPADIKTGRYILSVGHTNRRKNLEILPEVLSVIAHESPDISLVRAGAMMSDELAAKCRAAIGANRLIELGFVSDEELRWLYQNAGAFYLPSKLEGYGLPVAEAMAAGCPVVCSNVCSLPEVGADAPLYTAPDDVAAAASNLLIAINDESKREEMIARGRKRAANLTWEKHLDSLVGIYRDLS